MRISIKLEPFEAYQRYIAIKRHFSGKYDYFKYNGKVNVSKEKFDTRRDKYLFYKLSKKKEVVNYLLANVINDGPDFWVGNVRDDQADKVYNDWKRRQETLSYTFKQDLFKLKDVFDDNFKVPQNSHPHLMLLFMRNEICIETIIILDMLINYSKLWNKVLTSDIIWSNIYSRMVNYKPFLSIKLDKYKKIALDHFNAI